MCGNGATGTVFSLWSQQGEQDMKSHQQHTWNSWGYWQVINSLRCSFLVTFPPPNLLLKKVDIRNPMKDNSCTPFSRAAHREMLSNVPCVLLCSNFRCQKCKSFFALTSNTGSCEEGDLLCKNGLSQLFWQLSWCCSLAVNILWERMSRILHLSTMGIKNFAQ